MLTLRDFSFLLVLNICDPIAFAIRTVHFMSTPHYLYICFDLIILFETDYFLKLFKLEYGLAPILRTTQIVNLSALNALIYVLNDTELAEDMPALELHDLLNCRVVAIVAY